MNHGSTWAAIALVVATHSAAFAQNGQAESDLFPFVLPWNDATPSVVDMSGLLQKPAGRNGPLQIRDGHFYAGQKRIRFLGVNLCFGANFPIPADADQVAARMAKFGINCVRFHHMETSDSPNGLMLKDHETIDPAQLEKLDYLIARLKAHGIYTNLNLHVGRLYPGRPTWEGMPSYFKGVDNFDEAMIRDQVRFARNLLSHVNPYTKNRYADEPAVALVEINNENALFHEWSNGDLDEMPDPYAADLHRRWNVFLASRYQTIQSLKKAWNVKEEPPGGELLSNRNFERGLTGWSLEQQSGRVSSKIVKQAKESLLQLSVEEPANQGWHIQLAYPGLAFTSGKPYTLRFRARSDRPIQISVNAMQAHDPWRQLWSTQTNISPTWKQYEYVFTPSESDENGRITFSNLGLSTLRLDLTDVSLTPGGVVGLRPGEALGAIDWFRKRDFGSRTPQAQTDWIRFLWDLEERYWTGMYAFLKRDLGVKAAVVGTQMGWSSPLIQARLDAIDSHAYWQHPRFPGRPWDPSDWTIENIPMAGRADGGTLPRLALSRVVGKPFLCTEYNHSAPNTYGAETFPLIAAFAARQDWDGVFGFAYSHRRDDWDLRRIPSFFDIDQHPTKMVTWPAAVAMFLREDVPVAASSSIARPNPEDWFEAGRIHGAWGLGADSFGVDRNAPLRSFTGIALNPSDARKTPAGGSPGPDDLAAFSWQASGQDEPGVVTIDTDRTKAVIGTTLRGPYQLGDVTISPGPNRQNWACITLTALNGPNFRSPGKFLVTATGYCENTAMGWKHPSRQTVGRDWGQEPSLVEGIPALIELPVPASKVSAWPLDERGHRREKPCNLEGNATTTTLPIGPAYRTLWYEIDITN